MHGITFRVADVEPEDYYFRNSYAHKNHIQTPEQLLTWSSFAAESSRTNLNPAENGFISAVLSAYQGHYHLTIRPDDVWIAILTQFSLFVNANADTLADKFVGFPEMKELKVEMLGPGYRDGLNYGLLALAMSEEIDKNIVDPELKEWILPRFSTTTLDDKITSSLVMMSTLKQYFSVTLQGDKADWATLLAKIEKLRGYNAETVMWYHMLEPVLSRFVRAFDDPDGEWNREFWNRAATTETPRPGSGATTYLTGWLTAFIPFDNEGKWQLVSCFEDVIQPIPQSEYSQLGRAEFIAKYNAKARAYYHQNQQVESDQNPGISDASSTKAPKRLDVKYDSFGIQALGSKGETTTWYYDTGRGTREERVEERQGSQLVIDGTWYPRHSKREVTRAVVDVDVAFTEYETKMEAVWVVGLMGYQVQQRESDKEGEKKLKGEANKDWTDSSMTSKSRGVPSTNASKSPYESVISPKVGWWMYEKHPADVLAKRKKDRLRFY
ncbi:hypothetical protein BDZ91DRAFT_768402 [Kalaharituber pfeilii]|nr:hypothetical protein BDZ91DRAFT_768402 [Kalaharituber pfeilii]